jgi:monoamine oxidase
MIRASVSTGTENEAISRRRLFGAGAAAAAGAALSQAPGVGARPKDRKRRRADVAIVGAGFAGLTAARRLAAEGISAIVLEARDRVGGRAWNGDIGDGEITERGATFAGPTQDHVLALAAKMKVPTFPTYNTGDNLYLAEGTRLRYDASGPTGIAPPDPVILPDLAIFVLRLDEMATHVPVDAPWTAPDAANWDAQTLQQFVDANTITPRFRTLSAVTARPIFGAEPRELSLLYTLFYIAASGNEQNVGTFERNFNTAGGAQESRFVGGSQRICKRLAKKLGRRVVLRTPVHRISQDRGGVTVRSERLDVRAKRVIVAIPPVLTGKIDYEPGLPDQRIELIERFPQGNLTKVTAVYDRAFWRDDGLTGQVLSDKGPINVTFDDSPPDGSKGVVFGFVGGDSARSFAALGSKQARRAAALANFVDFFGPQAASPVKYIETVWKRQAFTRGCPVGILGPGALTAHGPAIRAPVGRIHWAGTETSTYWNGYMDGAVRSGERAAAEVAQEL